MKRIYNHIKLALLAFAILTLAISCTSDEFYGFEQTSNGNNVINYDVVRSPELVAYITELYHFVKNDTTKSYKKNKEIDSYRNSYLRRYSDLIEKYPEFEHMTSQDRIVVCNKCIDNNPNLRNLYGRKINRTKSGNPEDNTAWKSLANTSNSNITRSFNCEYDFLYNSKVQMFVFDNTTSAVSFAIINAMSGVNWANPQPEQFKEVSGYIFDNSSVALIDPDATNQAMTFVMWAWAGIMPIYIFIFIQMQDLMRHFYLKNMTI